MDVYKIGVSLAMTSNAPQVLSALSQQLLHVHAGVNQLQGGLNRLKVAIGGAFALSAGLGLAKGMEVLGKHGATLEHYRAQMLAAGYTAHEVSDAMAVSWANSGKSLTATASEGMKNLLELANATGTMDHAKHLLPAFTSVEAALSSVKDEDVKHTSSGHNHQSYNLARSMEEMGAMQNEEMIDHYAQGLTRTIIGLRGLVDGNKLFAMTNNSKGAAMDWDFSFATKIAPILAQIENPGRVGNQQYMISRGYRTGSITSGEFEGLKKYGFVNNDDAIFSDKGKFQRLKANRDWSEGINTNPWEWAQKKIEMMRGRGINVDDAKEMSKFLASIGQQQSRSALMRLLFDPRARKQIQRELDNVNRVPVDSIDILKAKDPKLISRSFHKQVDSLMEAISHPSIAAGYEAMKRLTIVVRDLSQFAAAHPEAMKALGVGVAGLSASLVGAGAVALLAALGPAGWLVLGIGALASAVIAAKVALSRPAPVINTDPHIRSVRNDALPDDERFKPQTWVDRFATQWAAIKDGIFKRLSETFLSGDSLAVRFKPDPHIRSVGNEALADDDRFRPMGGIAQVRDFLKQLPDVVTEGLSSYFEKVKQRFAELPKEIVGAIEGLPQQVSGAITNAISSIGSMLSSAISGLASMVSKAISAIGNIHVDSSGKSLPQTEPPKSAPQNDPRGRTGPVQKDSMIRPSSSSAAVHVATAVQLDGRTVARAVTRHQVAALDTRTGTGRFDDNGLQAPVGYTGSLQA